ncbi:MULTISPECIES: universal stress protein [Hafnia]|jgi:universal stress protein F|uniref:Universal stress protein n=1 Tax=Hafnia alvei ATCC 51873 TaxID=1002364 RepID=G9Y1H2_HAFAL|nr:MULTISPECIES: universal stress protein [Hafnia]EHM47939.1 universal stress family protein [Hafnia alvei ATCC 51873]OFS10522.1 universal stress protein UspA [Hafnia sp. HMSC23F03]QQE44482.1 universal stress protein [Hafnia alvei]
MDYAYKMILVPIDIEEPKLTEGALNHAAYLAKMSQAKIRLMNVRPSIPTYYMGEHPQQLIKIQDDATNKVQKELEALASALDLSADQVSVVVTWGSIYDEILKEAEVCGADLIVVGSRRPTMSTYLIGSNAARVVRHAKTSVLVVR